MIKMQLFGSFTLTGENGVLREDELHSGKLTKLLAYILIHRDRMLTHRQLVDVFWEDNSRNPVGALKNLMYRLRTELKVLGDGQYICTLPGAYRWNPEIPVETDYEQFENRIAQLRVTSGAEEKKELCREIVRCYSGSVSPRIADEAWILPKATWYQSMYMNTVKSLCMILEKEENWSELEVICNQALRLDALDEDIYCWEIRSLCGQKKHDLALIQYEKANKIFYESMGVRNPEKLYNVFREVMSETSGHTADIGKLLSDTRETKAPDGVFFCDYQIFRQIYQIEARRINRLGLAEHIMLLTLRRSGQPRQPSTSGADPVITEGMLLLEKVIRRSLRIGDVAARYSPTQFIVLLPACSYEAGVTVATRIQKRFCSSIGRRKLELAADLAELTAEIYPPVTS